MNNDNSSNEIKSAGFSRRQFLATSAAAAAAIAVGARAQEKPKKAQIAISLDLEMARNFPTWETTHWDYEKGNLNDETKKYALEAGRRVKAAGGTIHFFLVGRCLEQQNVDWLKTLIAEGHQIGNHTYDHAYIRAKTPREIQYRFMAAPWLIKGKTVPQVIEENIAMCTTAMKERLGITPAGFRAPGGFNDGLIKFPEIRQMLKRQGFSWVSTLNPPRIYGKPGTPPTPEILDSILKAQNNAQPFRYDDGLLEIPMAPISDIDNFRNSRWPLETFVEINSRNIQWAIDNGKVYDYLSHPGVLYSQDPQFKMIDAICELVAKNSSRAELVNLNQIAQSFS